DFTLWDEGLGWLAFRLIRPGFSDGYPFSRKDWGPGKGTISIWIPIIGFDQSQTIAFIPGSHKKKYEKFLPTNSKFTLDEFRLKSPVSEDEIYRPKLKPGQAIVFSPKTIHSEDVPQAPGTRFSLEFRIVPSVS
ncbi:phytanoyl-CoA dioxygenase family protein, partial [Alphaproteobacteria bacterium]|nr:phytanoyl-CoA dioxygenase family protein [Alphaproteobacteria bacterium]